MAQRYETLLLARTEITDDEQDTLKKAIESFAAESGGSLESFDRWGKYRLSYPVRKNEYGIYFLARYNADKVKKGVIVSQLDTFLKIKCNEFIMRSVTTILADNAPAAYEKPESIDSVGRPADIENLLKDNKIETLLHSVDASEDSETLYDEDMIDEAVGYDSTTDEQSEDTEDDGSAAA